MTKKTFEKIVRQALSELPEEFKSRLDNVDIVIKENPKEDGQRNLLGLYTGVPLTERSYSFAFPDKITIYKEPLLLISHDKAEIIQHVRQTVLHEIGHHFGLTDEELRRVKF